MKQALIAALLGACGLLHPVAAWAQQSQPAPIVGDGWEEIERLQLPGGVVQIRVKPKAGPASSATPAPPGPTAAVAKQAKDSAPKDPVAPVKDIVAVDLSVPASPAMAVIGMAGTEIQRPAFARDLVASLVRGFDKDGKVKNAMAIDVAPMALLAPRSIVGGDTYVQNPLMQVGARTTLSLAASQVDNADGASQLAAGLRIGLIDGADPGLNWRAISDCVARSMQGATLSTGRTTADSQGEAGRAKAEKDCAIDKQVADLWAKQALYVGYAQGWYSGTGSVKDTTGSARSAWASYSVGLNPRSKEALKQGAGPGVRALLQLYLARKRDDRVKDPAGGPSFVREDRTELIGRIRFGQAKWHGFVDAGRARVNLAGTDSENVKHLGFGFELQLSDDIWLVAGKVRETGYVTGERNLISTGLRFSQAPKGQFGIPGVGASE